MARSTHEPLLDAVHLFLDKVVEALKHSAGVLLDTGQNPIARPTAASGMRFAAPSRRSSTSTARSSRRGWKSSGPPLRRTSKRRAGRRRSESGARSLLQVAQESFLERFSVGEPGEPSTFATLRCWELHPPASEALASSEIGSVVGSLLICGRDRFVQVLSRRPLADGDAVVVARRWLLEAWLAERRRSAAIEWFWGREE
jgi:hypothetical protein